MRRHLLSSLIACAVAALLTAITAPAFARRTARVVYTRGPGADACPDETGLRNAVATRLGYDPFEASALAIVTASVSRTAGALEGAVQFHDEHDKLQGEKKLSSSADDCVELASAMALTISILLDPRAAMGQGEPSPDRAPPPVSPHESPFEPERPPPQAAPTTPPSEPLRLRVGAEAMGSVGAAPAPAIGVGGFVGIGRGALSIDLEGRSDIPASLARDDGTGVRSSLLLATLAPCGHIGVAALCALGSVGALHGEGFSVGTLERDTTPYAAVGVRAGIEIKLLSNLLLRTHADAVFPITQTTLKNRGLEYWTSPPIFGVLALGLMGQF